MDINDLERLQILCYLIALALFLIKKRKEIMFFRWWTKPHLTPPERKRYGAYDNVFTYFKLNDSEELYKYIGMNINQFAYLHELLHPELKKHSNRESLPIEFRLVITLKYVYI